MVAALEAVVACERLAAQLPQLAAWLDHAASVARADWTGPHRETFDDRVAAIRAGLLGAADTVHLVHRQAVRELTEHR